MEMYIESLPKIIELSRSKDKVNQELARQICKGFGIHNSLDFNYCLVDNYHFLPYEFISNGKITTHNIKNPFEKSFTCFKIRSVVGGDIYRTAYLLNRKIEHHQEIPIIRINGRVCNKNLGGDKWWTNKQFLYNNEFKQLIINKLDNGLD